VGVFADNGDVADIDAMAALNIRRLPEDVHAKLRVRAAKAGRSMEAEARMILAEAVRQPGPKRVDLAALRAFMERLHEGKLPRGVADDLIAERRQEARPELEESTAPLCLWQSPPTGPERSAISA
jgi:plasmid stability protein